MRDKTAGRSAEWQDEDREKKVGKIRRPAAPRRQRKKGAGKFAHYQNTAQLLANRLEHDGRLFAADMAASSRENKADTWPQELADYVADRLRDASKAPKAVAKARTA